MLFYKIVICVYSSFFIVCRKYEYIHIPTIWLIFSIFFFLVNCSNELTTKDAENLYEEILMLYTAAVN